MFCVYNALFTSNISVYAQITMLVSSSLSCHMSLTTSVLYGDRLNNNRKQILPNNHCTYFSGSFNFATKAILITISNKNISYVM